MMEWQLVVSWLDLNASAVLALAALTQLVVMSVLVFVTTKYVRHTGRLVEETRAQKRPYVLLELTAHGRTLWLEVSNVGEWPAINVVVDVLRDVTFKDGKQLLGTSFIKNGFSVLPPGKKHRYYLGSPASDVLSSRLLDPPEKRVLHYRLTYGDGRVEYSEEVTYDLERFRHTISEVFPLAGNDLALIGERLRELNDTVSNGFHELGRRQDRK